MAQHRSLPVPQPESEQYWSGLRNREIWLRHCLGCATSYFYPRDICPHCFSRNTIWRRSSGRGAIYALSIVHRPPTPHFKKAVPYVGILVELGDGVRIPSNLVGTPCDSERIRIGAAVEPVFEDVSDSVTLLKFRLAEPDPNHR